MDTVELFDKIAQKRIWHKEPVFCFTSDIDWASEPVLEEFLSAMCKADLKLTTFVTHASATIQKYKDAGLIERGIHPNFLSNSSHGDGFRAVAETCIQFAPEAIGFRSHRLFDVTDITHLLHDVFGFKYVSNLGTIMQPDITPILHESGLVHFPIFFEDGTHLFNKLPFDLPRYLDRFLSPGIKIIIIHPMNFVINPPEIKYMRNIKDTLSREEYNHMSREKSIELSYKGTGIRNMVEEIIDLAKKHRIMSLNEIYQLTIS